MIKLKSKEEIAQLKLCGRKNARVLQMLAGMIEPGISTLTLEKEAARLLKEEGLKSATMGYTPYGARRPFPATLCVSINEEIVHGIPNEKPRVLEQGDIVSLDLSASFNGYYTDSALTVPVGVTDDEALELLRVAEEALRAGISVALPGSRIGDIGAAISAVVKKSPFSLAKDLVGHGLGYALHEEPYVPNIGQAGRGEKLLPGLVIAVEPMVNAGKGEIKTLKDGYTIVTKDGSRSAHFEHTIAITEDGNIILTLRE